MLLYPVSIPLGLAKDLTSILPAPCYTSFSIALSCLLFRAFPTPSRCGISSIASALVLLLVLVQAETVGLDAFAVFAPQIPVPSWLWESTLTLGNSYTRTWIEQQGLLQLARLAANLLSSHHVYIAASLIVDFFCGNNSVLTIPGSK